MPIGERSGAAASSGPPSAAGDAVPERIDDRYRVLAELGRGGMARVYRVVDATAAASSRSSSCSVPGVEKQRSQAARCSSASSTRWRSSRIRA